MKKHIWEDYVVLKGDHGFYDARDSGCPLTMAQVRLNLLVVSAVAPLKGQHKKQKKKKEMQQVLTDPIITPLSLNSFATVEASAVSPAIVPVPWHSKKPVLVMSSIPAFCMPF